MKIERATDTDLYDLADLAVSGHLDHLHSFRNGKPEEWLFDWQSYIREDLGGMFLAKKHNKILGAIAWTIGIDRYDADRPTLEEEFWFVLPEYESSRLGTKLLEELLLYADSIGMETRITLGTMASPRTMWLLERYGFKMENIVLRRERVDGKES